MKRISLVLAVALGTTLAFPLVARADQAILVHDMLFDIGPGEAVEYDDVLVVSHYGIPTVVFDGATGFADDETVVATIGLSTNDIDGLGSVELLSSSAITGTTTADWTTDVSSVLTFQPAIELRYTAPSAAELGCDDHPGERFTTHLGVSATLVGSAGTTASFSAADFPSTVLFRVTCPASAPAPEEPAPEEPAPAAPTVTPPPTDKLPHDSAGSRGEWADWLVYLAVASGAGALVVLTLLSRPHRSRP